MISASTGSRWAARSASAISRAVDTFPRSPDESVKRVFFRPRSLASLFIAAIS